MRIPRDINGDELAKALAKLGYRVTRQTGSHMRLTIGEPTQHHITIPRHIPLRVGTLGAILAEVARHLKTDRDALMQELFY